MKTFTPYAEGSGFTNFSDHLIDTVMPSLLPSEWAVLCFINRTMGGLDKDCRELPLGRIQKGTGLSKVTVVAALARLSADGHISRIAISGYVYLLNIKGTDLYKIGMTYKTPDQRIAQFAPKMPYTAELVYTKQSANPMALEASLHQFYDDLRENGEWFRLSAADYASLIEYLDNLKE